MSLWTSSAASPRSSLFIPSSSSSLQVHIRAFTSSFQYWKRLICTRCVDESKEFMMRQMCLCLRPESASPRACGRSVGRSGRWQTRPAIELFLRGINKSNECCSALHRLAHTQTHSHVYQRRVFVHPDQTN